MSMVERTHDALCRLVKTSPGRKLPGERELAEQFGVGRQHVRQVLARLAAEGLVERRQGSGTYAFGEGQGLMRRVGLWVDRRLRLGDDPFFTLVIERLLQACDEAGVRCTVERVDGSDSPKAWEDGVITIGLSGAALLPRMKPGDPPAVGLFVDFDLVPGCQVSLLQMDDEGAGRTAAGWLMAEGCERLAFVGRVGLPASDARLLGARRAAEAAGVALEVWDARMNYSAGLSAGSALRPPKTGRLGVFCANDWLALGVHAGLCGHGPEGRSRALLAGVDGLPVVADPRVGVRSLRPPLEAIAADALAELRRLSGFPTVAGRVVRYPLVWASSEPSGSEAHHARPHLDTEPATASSR